MALTEDSEGGVRTRCSSANFFLRKLAVDFFEPLYESLFRGGRARERDDVLYSLEIPLGWPLRVWICQFDDCVEESVRVKKHVGPEAVK